LLKASSQLCSLQIYSKSQSILRSNKWYCQHSISIFLFNFRSNLLRRLH